MLKDQIRYTELADKTIVNIFSTTRVEIPQAEAMFSHILNAQHIWIHRIYKTEATYERFQIHSKESFEALHIENIRQLYQVLEDKDPEQVLSYKVFTGEVFENKIGDILFHVVNHSTYHRGQVASLLKQAGITPPVTDYVFLKRLEKF